MLARTPHSYTQETPELQSAAESGTARLARILAKAAEALPAPGFQQPAFRRHWKAPRNSVGGFKSYEDMKAEEAAKRAANYGPPIGPCSDFIQGGFAYGACIRCGWRKGDHGMFGGLS